MKTNPNSQSGIFNPRVLLAFALCSVGVFLAALGFATTTTSTPGWSLITSPNTSATEDNQLSSVACASASDCWAVGYSRNGLLSQTLIEHWNGTSWAIVPSPNSNNAGNNVLSAVACGSASDCWAVGFYTYIYNRFPPNPCTPATCTTYSQTLTEHWDGTGWIIVTSPNTSATENNPLFGIACTSPSDCWAVGSTIQHWDGNSWAITALPQSLSGSWPLVAVTCTSASNCWTIGNYGIDVLIERWDGNSWATVSSPSFNEQTAVPKAVTCASASECWAVGYYYNGSDADPVYYPFIERWNGTAWAFFPSPSTSLHSGVTCVSASNCWAVGNEIEHWDGTSWAVVPSPGTTYGLNGVTCASASECWAVGANNNGSHLRTLIDEFAPTIPPLTGVVSRKVHGSAGTFDIDLPLTGTRGVECRSGGPNGNYQIVFSFVNSVTNCGTASTGSLSSGPGSNQCTVNLTGVTNQQNLTVTLSNVLDSQTNTGNVSATMGVLIGDVNGNATVSNTDVAAVKAQVAAPLSASNFRNDVNANGILSNTDVSATKAQVGTSLP